MKPSGDRIYLFACSKSRKILDEWITQIKEQAVTSGVKFKGPQTQPKEEVGDDYFFRRSIVFPPSKRVQKVVGIEHSDQIFTKILVDSSIDVFNYSVKNIIPESELPSEVIPESPQDDSLTTEEDTETEDTSATEKERSEFTFGKHSDRDNDTSPKDPDGQPESTGAEYDASTGAPQYTRSDLVRDLVMERAGGVCEGCNEPAPFHNKRGEPYLHAHHVYELSKGGPDTPQSVVAICPNCHYRIHHGQDGDEYNAELIDNLPELLG